MARQHNIKMDPASPKGTFLEIHDAAETHDLVSHQCTSLTRLLI